ncbi:MAG: acyl--CoA ligase [Sphingomonadales bacterium]|nr:acyl--CoA ligase [Sphingomonadales bacterium]
MPRQSDMAIIHGIPLAEEPGQGAHTLPGLLREACTRWPGNEALVFHHPDGTIERWTYGDLWSRAVEVARSLVALGLGRDARVGILMTNRPEWVSACFGAALAGCTATGFSTFSTAPELDALLGQSAVSVLLLEGRVLAKDFAAMLHELEPALADPGPLAAPKWPYLRHIAALNADCTGAIQPWQAFLQRGQSVPEAQVHARAAAVTPADPALLVFSSGSTGKPKGILNSHRGVCIQSWRVPRIYNVTGVDSPGPFRAWSANGLFWSGNWAFTLGGTLACGGCLILQRTFDPAEAIHLFESERVNFPYCWPHQWAQLEERPEWDSADLSSFHYFDAECFLHRPQPTITTRFIDPRASYGSTETFTISASYPCGTPEDVWRGTSGEALPGMTIRIVDPRTGETLKRGETGEIAVKGPTLMLGYIGIPNDEALDGDGFYRSGDGGHIDAQGRLFFAGRINDIIKTGGANVSPVEIDWTLCSCPGVKVCKTTGVPHPTLGEMVVSLVVPEAGATVAEADVIAWLKPKLASYKLPRRVLVIPESELGLTDTAKIKPAEARALAARLMAPAQDH